MEGTDLAVFGSHRAEVTLATPGGRASARQHGAFREPGALRAVPPGPCTWAMGLLRGDSCYLDGGAGLDLRAVAGPGRCTDTDLQ
ncbi:hypothetical protein thsps21_27930 [Pseudomonas sp. No.21]|nr:hypothetical protein TUM20249_12620 [Pseudomonas tohonis]